MNIWRGAAGVCINERGELLMVLQGKPHEEKKWSVPAGGLEAGETIEECCVREISEETGYIAEVGEKLFVKSLPGIEFAHVEVHYFFVKILGGEMKIQDPDELIHEIAWKSLDELQELDFAFPEDRDFLIELVEQQQPIGVSEA
ncbi:NUDIX hydrolase [Chungangia koreensis]|uniref:NUDIX hydrolase n=1 Tax=Chungangia koreensis TaxID=752657 RepID=A0ABV8X061_9LACT